MGAIVIFAKFEDTQMAEKTLNEQYVNLQVFSKYIVKSRLSASACKGNLS